MKRNICLLFFLSLTIISCHEAIWVGTDKGGCNELTEAQINTKRNVRAQTDTVYHSVKHEVMSIHVGFTHLCCTPFETTAKIIDNEIIMEIIDVCPGPDFNCYCRCNCYYTFDFNFKDFELKNYPYQLFLKKPKADKKLINTGHINIKSLGLR